jgi:hypothetical protein
VQSSGSIGGGKRAYDDRDVQSSGSIGGGRRTYDDPNVRSSGSIGGETTAQRGEQRTVADSTKGDYTHADHDQHADYDRVQERRTRTHDDEDIQSSGSIGGSAR